MATKIKPSNLDFTTLNIAVSNTGNVGIGTSSPAEELHIQATAPTLRLQDSDDSAYTNFIHNAGGFRIDVDPTAAGTSSFFRVDVDGSERMRIDSLGNVLIGTSTSVSNNKLVIEQSSGDGANSGFFLQRNGAAGTSFKIDIDSSDVANFRRGVTNAMSITSAGNVGIGTDSPTALLHLIGGNILIGTDSGDSFNSQSRLRIQGEGSEYIQIKGDGTGQLGLLFGAASDNFLAGILSSQTDGNDLRFNAANTERMRITSSGNVGIGTASPASIVGGTDTSPVLSIGGTDTTLTTGDKAGSVSFITNDTSYTGTYADGVTAEIASVAESSFGAAYGLAFYTGHVGVSRGERMRITSAGNVGVGVTPSAWGNSYKALQILGPSGTVAGAFWQTQSNLLQLGNNVYSASGGDTYYSTAAAVKYTQTTSEHRWYNAPSGTAGNAITFTQAMTLDASGNLGIGTATPIAKLTVSMSTASLSVGNLSTDVAQIGVSSVSDSIAFGQFVSGGATFDEKVRIDSSGTVLIGKTTADSGATSGIEFEQVGLGRFTRDTTTAVFDRLSTDGTIVSFRKDGTTVGIIGTYGDDLYWSGATGAGIRTVDASNRFYPCTSAGVTSDNTHDWGYSTARFNDIYATNGVTTTSDRNEKQDIEELSEAERRVAVACKGLLRKYRWKDAVAEKGDAARIHFGIIAQDLQAAFEAEGLDAGRYAMFISSTWWEMDEVVPATETEPERTVKKIYDAAEEAPEGATERTRLGVRYPELLAFIIAVL